MPEKFENRASFLQLGLSSTLIRHENGAFRKRSSNQRYLKTPALRFSVDGKHFENESFDVMIIMINLRPSFPQTLIQMASKFNFMLETFKSSRHFYM